MQLQFKFNFVLLFISPFITYRGYNFIDKDNNPKIINYYIIIYYHLSILNSYYLILITCLISFNFLSFKYRVINNY